MIEEIFLTILIILFINICLFEDKLKPKESISIQRVRSYLKTISLKKFVLSFILPLFLIILYLWLLGIRDFLTIYLYTGISLLILLHTFWLFGKIQKSYFILFLILSVFTIFARAIIPIEIIRDLFVILAITWLGPVITSFKFFKKIFLL